MKRIPGFDPAAWRRHPIHGGDRAWAETNCYSDVIIELVHALGFEPRAALPFTLAIDFEGDQWTFFKFRPQDLRRLYGLDLVELAPWRPLAEHVEAQVALGRPVLVELDSFFLPDTAGTAYRLAHVKSTVAVMEIDRGRRQLGYFHNQGYHRLEGEDFAAVFQVDGLVHERMLPPYIEFVKRVPGFAPLSAPALLAASLTLLSDQLRELPAVCPFVPFKEAFRRDSEWLPEAGLEVFHAYSFATFRQFGACFELAATYLAWLGDQGVGGIRKAEAAFRHIAETTKALQFQLARAMARRKPLDPAPLDDLARLWEEAMGSLAAAFAP